MARPRKAQELDIGRRAVEESIRLVAQRGDFDVPLAAVAQAIGCTAPALYGHFRNKCALLRAVRDEGFNRLYEVKAAVSERMPADPFGYLREGSYAYVRFALDNPTLYQLMFSPPPRLGVSDDPWSSENPPARRASPADMENGSLDPSPCVALWTGSACPRSIPEPLRYLASDHGARFHHDLVAGQVGMAKEPCPCAAMQPVGVAAILPCFQTEGAQVFGPMGLWFHHDGDAVADLFPGQRPLGHRVGKVVAENLVYIDDAGHGTS